MSTELQAPNQTAILAPSGTRSSLAPTNLTEAMRFSEMLANSNFVPKDFQGKPGDILVAIQWGMEIGLAPLQSLQNVAVINGRPSIWGDAQLALVQAHPEYVRHDEGTKGDGDSMVGWHTIERRGHAPYTVEFSVADAKKANLWDKAGPWKTSPKRMLKLRARGFALRDKFADALKGIISREEAQDIPVSSEEPSQAQAAQEEAVVTREQALDFWKTWKNIGKRKDDEAVAYLADVMKVDSSMKIPASRFDEAMAWARCDAPKEPQKPAESAKGAEETKPATPAAEKKDGVHKTDPKGEVLPKAETPKDDEQEKRIVQLFAIHELPEMMQASLRKDYEGRLGDLIKNLESDLPPE